MTRDPRIGTLVAGYRIEALIGRGGMGIVYRARDTRLDRDVALKVLPEELGGDLRFRDRFLAESRLAASIEHPNIVPVHEAGDANGALFIAMRYVHGSDLGTMLARDGALDPAQAVAVVTGIADALDAAHARGLVHRDVKPGNILVARSHGDGAGHVYLADFGISKRLTGVNSAPTTGVLGTVDYVAPEQIEGSDVDARADLYSLGCVLYACLVREPPFVRDTPMSVAWAHVHEPPPSVSSRRPELPTVVDEVIARALAKRPGERYQSGAELADAARLALGLSPSAAARAPLRSRALDEHCGEIVRLALRGRLVFVLGSGVNRCREPSQSAWEGVSPPDDGDLANRLAEAFGFPGTAFDLPRVSQAAAVTHGPGPVHDELHDLLAAEFDPGPPHRLLAGLPRLLRARNAPCPLIVTTAYDVVLERAFAEAGEQVDVVTYVGAGPDRGCYRHRRIDGTWVLVEVPNTYAELSLEQRPVILRLHGYVDEQPDRARESFVVTEDDHIGYLQNRVLANAIPVTLAAALRRSHLLFLGCKPSEWSIRAIFAGVFGDEPPSYRSFAVADSGQPLEREHWRFRGVDVVDAELEAYVDALAGHLEPLAAPEAEASA
jgi:serine/threonine-protein kinase